MKTIGIIVGCALVVLTSLWVSSSALSLMNQPSDVAVLIGVVILAALVGVWVVGIRKARNLMKKSAPLALLIAIVSMTSATGCKRVDAGYVGVKISMAGDSRGVNDIPTTTGWVFYNPLGSNVYEYPTFMQTATWTKDPNEGLKNNEEISFNTKEGLIVNGDISLSYQLDPAKVPAFYVKFRSDDLNTFTDGFLRNTARDAFNEVAGKYSVEEIYGPKKEEFVAAVRAKLNESLSPIGVTIEQFGFIGAPRPPQSVIDAINAKITATQQAMQAENELRKAKAEADKVVATAEGAAKANIAKAKGEAEANRALTASISNELLEWRRLQITEQAVAKWNGQRPMVEGGSNSGLLLQLPVPNAK